MVHGMLHGYNIALACIEKPNLNYFSCQVLKLVQKEGGREGVYLLLRRKEECGKEIRI